MTAALVHPPDHASCEKPDDGDDDQRANGCLCREDSECNGELVCVSLTGEDSRAPCDIDSDCPQQRSDGPWGEECLKVDAWTGDDLWGVTMTQKQRCDAEQRCVTKILKGGNEAKTRKNLCESIRNHLNGDPLCTWKDGKCAATAANTAYASKCKLPSSARGAARADDVRKEIEDDEFAGGATYCQGIWGKTGNFKDTFGLEKGGDGDAGTYTEDDGSRRLSAAAMPAAAVDERSGA